MNEPTTRDTMLELEAEKLRVEISNLKKTWIKNPASWVSIMTIVLALFGLAFQYRNHKAETLEAQSKLDQVQAELKKSQERLNDVEGELKRKEPRLNEVQAEIDRATNDLKQLAVDRERVETELVALNVQLKELEEKAKYLPKTADNQQIQNSASTALASVSKLKIANREIVEKSKVITDKLDASKARRAVSHQ